MLILCSSVGYSSFRTPPPPPEWISSWVLSHTCSRWALQGLRGASSFSSRSPPGARRHVSRLSPQFQAAFCSFQTPFSQRQIRLGCRAQLCPGACGWPGAGWDHLCVLPTAPAGPGRGCPALPAPGHLPPGHHCPLPALPAGPVSFPQLHLHSAAKAAEIRSVLLSKGHLEIKPSAFGVPGLTSLLPDHLRGPGCPGTLWLAVQRSLFSGRQPVFLQAFKANYPASVSTDFCFVLFCNVFWVFSGGDPAAREQLLWVQTWWSPTKAIQSRGGLLSETFLPWLPATLRRSGICGVSLCASAS